MRKKFYQKRPRKRSVDFVNLGVILVVLAVVGISFYQYFAKADTPAPSSYVFSSGKLIIGLNKTMPNSGNTNDPSSIKNTFMMNDSLAYVNYTPAVSYGTKKLYEMSSSSLGVPVASGYYLYTYESKFYNQGGGVDSTTIVTKIYKKSGSDYSEYSPGNSTLISAYITWLNSTTCTVSATDPSALSYVSHNSPTTMITEQNASAGSGASWYYVAYGNYSPTASSLVSVYGYIYVNSEGTKYILVSDTGTISKTFTVGSVPNEWVSNSPAYSVDGWKAPNWPSNTLSLKSLSVDISSALGTLSSTYASANSAPGQEPTIEILLGGNNGPNIVKNQGEFDPTFTHIIDTSVAGPAYIVSRDDINNAYTSTSDTVAHLSKLITQVTICAHKSLTDSNTGSPYISNGKTIDVLDSASKYFGGSEITNSGTVWAEKSSPLAWSITSQTNTQTCGTTEDLSTASGVGEGLSSGGNTILDAITNALKGLASIIQKAIIQFVALIIVWVTGYVPI